MTGTIHLRQDGHAATLTIDNPEQRNALTPGMLEVLHGHLDTLAGAGDGSPRAVVLQGAAGTFSSGFALDRFPEPAELPETDAIELLCRRIERAPFVVVAQIEGLCVGAALDVACACDVRCSTPAARLGITPAKLGLVYSWRGMQRIQRVAGREAARRLLLSGELVRADSHIGRRLVSELADDGPELDEVVDRLVGAVATAAPLSIAGAKWALEALDDTVGLDRTTAREHHRRRQAAMASQDAAEARTARSERRPPRFTGR